jgi:hypothetical protein
VVGFIKDDKCKGAEVGEPARNGLNAGKLNKLLGG